MSTNKSLIEKMTKGVKHKIVMDPRSYRMAHPIYSKKDAEKVKYTHLPPTTIGAKFTK